MNVILVTAMQPLLCMTSDGPFQLWTLSYDTQMCLMLTFSHTHPGAVIDNVVTQESFLTPE